LAAWTERIEAPKLLERCLRAAAGARSGGR
jgi:hypothetical protein